MIGDIGRGAKALLEFIGVKDDQTLQWESKVLGTTPGLRRVVAYRFYRQPFPEGKPLLSCIVKFYSDERGQRTSRVMEIIFEALAGTGAPPLLAIPQLLFYDPRERFIAQQPAEGVLFTELLKMRDRLKYFREAGKALGLLHGLRIPFGETRSIQDHLNELIHPHPLFLAERIPEYGPLIESLLKGMDEREKRWAREIEMAPLHRDFHLRQLFYGNGRVWLIDWDLFAQGDPALDVGNFLVYLKTHLTEKCNRFIDVFLEGYFSDRSQSLLKRISLYEALTYLRLACKRFRLKEEGWREKTAEMLLMSEKQLLTESVYAKV